MADEAAFTPGPWSVGKAVNGCWIEAGHAAQLVSIGRTFYDSVGAETEEANARLIAAAPTLYDELDIRVSDLVMLRKAIEAGDPKAELLNRIETMILESRAALAKATVS